MISLRNKVFNTLRSSERLFNLDMVYAVKGGLWTTLRFSVSLLGSIATMVAFGNLLSREAYGTYNYLLSLAASLSFLTFSGVGTAVLRAVARGYENIVPFALRLQLKYNLIAISVVLSAAIYYGYKGDALFALSLTLLALAYPLAEAFHIYEQVLTSKKRFDILAKIDSLNNLATTVVVVITLLLTNNILILVGIYTLMSLGPNILSYWWSVRDLDKSEPNPETLAEMHRTAFHITGAGLIGTASQYIDKIILFQVAGPAALAIYSFATTGPERIKGLIKNWVGISVPKLAQKSTTQIHAIFYKRICFSVLIGTLLALTYTTLSPLLFELFLPRYLDSISYSQVYALGLIAIPATVYIGAIFATQNMLRATYTQSVASQITRIILFLIFGWLWQAWGLVIGSVVSNFINALYSIIIWEWEYRRLTENNV